MFATLKRNWCYLNLFSKNIGYTGWLGYGNLGDEAMYTAFQRMFQKFNIVQFKDTKKIKLFEDIINRKIFNAVCLGGGTLINDSNYCKTLKIAQSKNYPTFVFGSGVRDPVFWDRFDKNCLKEFVDVLNGCFYVGVRGPLSKEILQTHGYKKAEITGDPALFLAGQKIRKKEGDKRLGVNIGISQGHVWGREDSILDFIVKFAKMIIKDGWKITFLPVWEKDLPYIEEAKKRIGMNIPIFYEFHSVNKTLNFLEDCDLFIGEKLHSVILALCAHTPSIMLEYRPKCLDFMASMGLEKYSIRTDMLNLDLVVELLNELYQDLDGFQRVISRKVNFYKEIQKEKIDIITGHILKGI